MVVRNSALLLSFFVGTQVLTQISFAALPRPQAPATSSTQRQIGGQAGAGFSLMNLQRIEAPSKKHERLIFSIGTREGRLLKGAPGYFNAQNAKNKITIDFAQMPYSRIDEAGIKKILKNSNLIRSVKVSQDPMDKTLTMMFDLKAPVKMKTLQVKGEKQTARIVLDIIKK